MPFKSQAQRRKFAELLVKGEITPETFEEWNRETGAAELPEHAGKKPAKKRATKKATSKKRATKKRATKKRATKKRATKKRTAKKR
jgi:topoisomerase IA-like protein